MNWGSGAAGSSAHGLANVAYNTCWVGFGLVSYLAHVASYRILLVHLIYHIVSCRILSYLIKSYLIISILSYRIVSCILPYLIKSYLTISILSARILSHRIITYLTVCHLILYRFPSYNILPTRVLSHRIIQCLTIRKLILSCLTAPFGRVRVTVLTFLDARIASTTVYYHHSQRPIHQLHVTTTTTRNHPDALS